MKNIINNITENLRFFMYLVKLHKVNRFLKKKQKFYLMDIYK